MSCGHHYLDNLKDFWRNVRGKFPKGVIVFWSGKLADIPNGWILCDGSKGTPDMANMFVIGASSDSQVKTAITQSSVVLLSVTANAAVGSFIPTFTFSGNAIIFDHIASITNYVHAITYSPSNTHAAHSSAVALDHGSHTVVSYPSDHNSVPHSHAKQPEGATLTKSGADAIFSTGGNHSLSGSHTHIHGGATISNEHCHVFANTTATHSGSHNWAVPDHGVTVCTSHIVTAAGSVSGSMVASSFAVHQHTGWVSDPRSQYFELAFIQKT